MKNLLLTIILLIFVAEIKSQIIPGSFSMKGSSGLSSSGSTNSVSLENGSWPFSSTASSKTENKSFSFGTQLGFFPSHHVNFGIYLSYNSQESVSDWTSSDNAGYGFGPYLRIYFTKFKINPFIQASLGYQNLKSTYKEQSNASNHVAFSGSNYDFAGGLEYFITDHFSIEMQVDKSYSSLAAYNDDERDILGSNQDYKYKNSGWNFKIGITLMINKETKDSNKDY